MIPSDVALSFAFEATWPAAETVDTGALRSGRGLGAGGRVSSSIALRPDWDEAQIGAAEDVHRRWGQRPMFRLPDCDEDLRGALMRRGYQRETPTAILAAECAALVADLPEMTAIAVWPPLAIQRDLWAAGNIGPARQAVMDRVPGPRTSIIGRIDDRAAGAAFVALAGSVAMIHGIEVASQFRRRGLAGWMIRKAARWAQENGATRLGLAVSRSNAGARAVYDRLGFHELGSYAYWARD
ncbi:GNAT family N-acetyltransferase [Paracoccus sp. MBLB3053]|uniref:GNAT family N-acetyltransferase n=1 Tax=Paracoccus aurantius TaxID=3073814 RepID=A0ABU2HMH6_9RHOB|nr:GNAT family N-acetyltransferase [Paracoccus sp. MBLB3053]MDS9466229.1 GNAT family N-acetyltransferase [Paracoccus sp. MBLB3053]